MKAILFEQPHSVKVATRDLRPLGPGEILVRVEACGVCGTDVHIVEGTARSSPPVVLGHEFAGTVEEVGKEVSGIKRGQKVAVDPNIACGVCPACRRGDVHLCSNLRALGVDVDGGMAQYTIVPRKQAYVLPEGFPEPAMAFVEPVSCVLHGIDRAGIKQGDTVAILGAGTIGLMMLQLVRHSGAARTIVVEPRERKRATARKLGADTIVDPSENDPLKSVRSLAPEGVDVVIECAGNAQTALLAVELARKGGTVEFFGVCPIGTTIPLEPNLVYAKELTIVGSYVNPHTFSRAITVLERGIVDVEEFQTDRFSLDQIQEALEFQREGKTIKSIIVPSL
ncbi:MAG: zinc-dependent alcohol dehydrogenase family protein [Bacteroidota bacterium]